jgi:hypothetical protein
MAVAAVVVVYNPGPAFACEKTKESSSIRAAFFFVACVNLLVLMGLRCRGKFVST